MGYTLPQFNGFLKLAYSRISSDRLAQLAIVRTAQHADEEGMKGFLQDITPED